MPTLTLWRSMTSFRSSPTSTLATTSNSSPRPTSSIVKKLFLSTVEQSDVGVHVVGHWVLRVLGFGRTFSWTGTRSTDPRLSRT